MIIRNANIRVEYHVDLCVTRKTWEAGLKSGHVKPLLCQSTWFLGASLTGDVISARVSYAGHTYLASSPKGGNKVEMKEI